MQHSSQEFPGDEATDYESIKQRIQQKPEAPVQRHSTEELLEEISELKGIAIIIHWLNYHLVDIRSCRISHRGVERYVAFQKQGQDLIHY